MPQNDYQPPKIGADAAENDLVVANIFHNSWQISKMPDTIVLLLLAEFNPFGLIEFMNDRYTLSKMSSKKSSCEHVLNLFGLSEEERPRDQDETKIFGERVAMQLKSSPSQHICETAHPKRLGPRAVYQNKSKRSIQNERQNRDSSKIPHRRIAMRSPTG